jgi:putative N6-adenine-specific DNA methylase
MDNFDIIVSAASGIESVTKKELASLGFRGAKAIDGRITVRGDAYDVADLNMFLRTADRVFMKLFSARAETFDNLFDITYAYDWDAIIPFNAKIIVNGKSRRSRLFSLSDCQKIIKKAIIEKLAAHYKKHIFPESGETYKVEFSITDDEASLMLDTSGTGLHKRGYRDLVGEAPIKETLACAMLSLSDFSADRPFRDPFCGSGTIVIEAARKALNVAPGRDRTFAYEAWDFMPRDAKKLSLEKASAAEIRDADLMFFGSDIDKNAIQMSMRHAERAGVGGNIRFETLDARNFSSGLSGGCIVTNPPYGERLLTLSDAYALYSAFGKTWRALDNWSAFVITSAPLFEKYFGKKCDAERKFFNAEKECRFYQYFRK